MMFVDDPMADEYDKHGRYYPKETRMHQVSAISTFEEMMSKNERLNLFHRGDRRAQLLQLRHMNLRPNFFGGKVWQSWKKVKQR